MASAQLQLIHTDHTWKLDRHTVQVGQAGIAQARAALAAATKDSDTEGQLFSYNVGRSEDRTIASSRPQPTPHPRAPRLDTPARDTPARDTPPRDTPRQNSHRAAA